MKEEKSPVTIMKRGNVGDKSGVHFIIKDPFYRKPSLKQ